MMNGIRIERNSNYEVIITKPDQTTSALFLVPFRCTTGGRDRCVRREGGRGKGKGKGETGE